MLKCNECLTLEMTKHTLKMQNVFFTKAYNQNTTAETTTNVPF